LIPLPQCRWRGAESVPGHHACYSPKISHPHAGVRDELCLTCYLRDHPPPAPVQKAPEPKPCAHLGGPTGERVRCPSCRGHVEVKLQACTMHGRCTTHKRVEGVACCQGCPDYRAAT